MKRPYDIAAAMPDLFFALTYAAIPLIAGAIEQGASIYPQIHLRIGLLNLFIYPLTCAAMIHLVASQKDIQEGALFLKKILWKSLTWPAGILFWTALFFHSVWMTMSFAWGELIAGTDIYSLAGITDYAAMISGWIFFFISSVYIASSLSGINRKKLRVWLEEWLPRKAELNGALVLHYTILALLGPVIILIILSIIIVIPFYLYCIVWWHIFNKSGNSGKKKALPFKTIPVPEFIVKILIYLYAVIMAFFFDAGVSHMVEISRSPGGYMPFWLATLFAMGLFYIPYRTFFTLGSGRKVFPWLTFLAGIIIVFAETYRRFHF